MQGHAEYAVEKPRQVKMLRFLVRLTHYSLESKHRAGAVVNAGERLINGVISMVVNAKEGIKNDQTV